MELDPDVQEEAGTSDISGSGGTPSTLKEPSTVGEV